MRRYRTALLHFLLITPIDCSILSPTDRAAQIQEHFDALMAKGPNKLDNQEVAALRKRIEEDQALLIQWAEEKTLLATTGHDMLQSNIDSIEMDMAALADDLQRSGQNLVDDYVDDYSMDIAQEPQGRKSAAAAGNGRMNYGNAYDFDPGLDVKPSRKTTIPLSLSRAQSGYISEGYGSDMMTWDSIPKRNTTTRMLILNTTLSSTCVQVLKITIYSSHYMLLMGAGRTSAQADGFGTRRRAASAAVHATAAAVAALDEEDVYGDRQHLAGGGMPLQFSALEPFIPGLEHAAKEPQAEGTPLTEGDIGPELVGRVAEVFWPDETNPDGSLWYLVKIETVDMARMTASIRYQNGEMEEELNLSDVARDGHMLLIDPVY